MLTPWNKLLRAIAFLNIMAIPCGITPLYADLYYDDPCDDVIFIDNSSTDYSWDDEYDELSTGSTATLWSDSCYTDSSDYDDYFEDSFIDSIFVDSYVTDSTTTDTTWSDGYYIESIHNDSYYTDTTDSLDNDGTETVDPALFIIDYAEDDIEYAALEIQELLNYLIDIFFKNDVRFEQYAMMKSADDFLTLTQNDIDFLSSELQTAQALCAAAIASSNLTGIALQRVTKLNNCITITLEKLNQLSISQQNLN